MPEKNSQWGPTNPHPLSTRRTELVWEGKYDEYGNRREVDVAGMAMPLQKIETVDEPRSRAEGQGKLFESEKAHRDDFRNMLIWGDNKLVMASMLKDFRGKVDLIYIDPPFDVGADFTLALAIGDGDDEIEKEQSLLEAVAYRDTWGRGMESYLHMMAERLTLLRELLADNGSIYVHCDHRVASHLKVLCDEVFGRDHFLNAVTWRRQIPRGMKVYARYMPFSAEYLLLYSKGETAVWNGIRKETLISIAEAEKKYMRDERGFFRTSDPGTYSDESIIRLHEEGRIYVSKGGELIIKNGRVSVTQGSIGVKYYREQRGDKVVEETIVDNIWDDIPGMGVVSSEWLGYPTQKPEGLLQRVIEASSNEGDLVADLFGGSGTTGVVAERLNRRWLMCDLGRFAIHLSRKRLLTAQGQLHARGQPYRSFDVYNLGRYERQWWQQERLKGADDEHRRVVMNFFKAEPLTASPAPSLHGKKGPAFVHVDAIDTLLTRDELRNVVRDAAGAGATEVICLSWEFEMDLKLVADALQQEFGVKARLFLIPREIMERNRTTPPPFFEVATLKAEPFTRNVSGKKVWDIRLTDFLPSLAEVPNKEIEALKERAIENGFDFIDFWAVDFDYHHDQPFHHDWQAYRTRKNRKLPIESDLGFELNGKKSRTACVKVVDIFGCDTSITVEVPA